MHAGVPCLTHEETTEQLLEVKLAVVVPTTGTETF